MSNKTTLKEEAEKAHKRQPKYVTEKVSGSDNDPTFRSTVVTFDGKVGQGTGKSKVAAEEAAAGEVLRQ